MTHSSEWKFDKPIIEVICDIDPIIKYADIQYFLAGATARDIMDKLAGAPSQRLTMDIDLAVNINGWDVFYKITDLIVGGGKFHRNSKPMHRFIHKATNIPIDIIPYGSIENKEHEIQWPDPDSPAMSTLGFREAYESAIPIMVSIDSAVTIKIASRLGLTIMKIISWDDNRARRTRDAKDLLHIIRHYLTDANIRRMYEDHADIPASNDFDFECAGARLLGRDIAGIASPKVFHYIRSIISREAVEDGENRLVIDMMSSQLNYENDFESTLRIIRALGKGLAE